MSCRRIERLQHLGMSIRYLIEKLAFHFVRSSSCASFAASCADEASTESFNSSASVSSSFPPHRASGPGKNVAQPLRMPDQAQFGAQPVQQTSLLFIQYRPGAQLDGKILNGQRERLKRRVGILPVAILDRLYGMWLSKRVSSLRTRSSAVGGSFRACGRMYIGRDGSSAADLSGQSFSSILARLP